MRTEPAGAGDRSPPRWFALAQRRGGWVMVLLGSALALFVLGSVLFGTALPPVTTLQQAERCLQAVPSATGRIEELVEALARPPQGIDESCWQPVALPDVSPPDAGAAGVASLTIAWYRFPGLAAIARPAGERLWIFLPRIVGGPSFAWVEGQAAPDESQRYYITSSRTMTVRVPRVPQAATQGTSLLLGIGYDREYGYSISRLKAGTPEALGYEINLRRFLREELPVVSNFVLLSLGALFFMFWLARRQEATHLLLPLAGIAWAIFNLRYGKVGPPDGSWYGWYDAALRSAINWGMWLIYLFVLRFDDFRSRTLELLLPVLVLLVTAAQLPLYPVSDYLDGLVRLASAFTGVAVTAYITWRAWASGRIELKWISASLIFSSACGVHDALMQGRVVDPEGFYWLPLSILPVYGSMMYALLRRYVAAINAAERFNDDLKRQLADQSHELQLQHQRLRLAENQRVLLEERERLMGDMHDGLGSALTSTLVAVEQGTLRPEQITAVLRDCVEDLRMVIDSLEPIGHDLELLLATIRHRLGSRLAAAGIELQWHTSDVPRLDWLESPQALQLMRIVQEILANIVKHAGARHVAIDVRHEAGAGIASAGGEAVVVIGDDGAGFDARSVRAGRGLRNLRSRTELLGGSIRIDSRPGAGTRVELRLPVRSPRRH
jgi:signal transduction histidine kinase